MKLRSLFSALIVCLVAFAACDKSNPGPVMSTEPGNPSITAPESGQSYTLTEEQVEDELLTIEWTKPDYGFSSAPSFIIQMDQAGDNFEEPHQLATVTGNSYTITVGDMNNVLLGQGMQAGEEASLEFRVMASLADSLDKQVSEPITLGITPFSLCQYCPAIYVPGSYQSASGYGSDWTPGDAPALNSIDDQDVYEGYVYMANGGNQFKLTPNRDWSLDFGDDGGDGTLEVQSSNLELADAGYYLFNVDLNAMTYSTTNTQWGIIGSATANGWDSDQDMTYDPATKTWTITADLVSGEMKFRANDDWAINYGDTGGDGTLQRDGDNIAISSGGSYTITLDLSSSPYTYTLTQN